MSEYEKMQEELLTEQKDRLDHLLASTRDDIDALTTEEYKFSLDEYEKKLHLITEDVQACEKINEQYMENLHTLQCLEYGKLVETYAEKLGCTRADRVFSYLDWILSMPGRIPLPKP